MAKSPQKDFAGRRGVIEAADTLGSLLDPHLHSPTENVANEESWSLRKTFLLIVGVSLLLWALTIAIITFVSR